ILDRIEEFLSTISKDVHENYGKCAMLTSLFLQLTYKHYKLNENLLEIFSDFLIVEGNNTNQFSLNRSASYVLQRVLENHLYDGDLSSKVLDNITSSFNIISPYHREVRDYCLRILHNLNQDQLKSMHLNATLLSNCLKDQYMEESLKSYVAGILGNLCQVYDTSTDNDTNIYMDDDTIRILLDGLDNQNLVKHSIYALHNIVKYKQHNLSSLPLRNIIRILDQDNISNEIRQNACSIIALTVENNQTLTKYETEVLANVLNEADFDTCNTTLITFQYFFQALQPENVDDSNIKTSCAERISASLTEFLFNRDEILCLNASILLKLIIEKNFKTEFTEYEINNICTVLQTHPNELVRQYSFDILQKIDLKQSNIPQNTHDLIKLELITQKILKKEILNEQDYITFESNLDTYLNDVAFGNKILPMNVFEAFDKILKMNSCTSTIILLLLRYVQNGQKLPNQLIETLGDQLLNDKNQILIQILYYVVHNGQLLADKTIK
ncbi:unnamed protein product, partial [Didymodactylos carnosus]